MLTTKFVVNKIIGMAMPLSNVIGKTEPFGCLAQEAYLNLWRASGLLGVIHNSFFEAFGLTPHQYNVLRILRGKHTEPVSMGGIRRQLVTAGPDVTRLVDRLVRKKLAVRFSAETNRRTVMVRITDDGIALLKRIDRPLLEMHQQQLGHLSEKDLRSLIKLLEKVRAPHERTAQDKPGDQATE